MIRVEVRDALKDALTSALGSEVTIAKGWNAKESTNEQVWIGGSRGAFEYEIFARDALPHEDQFSFDVLVLAAKAGQDQDRAETRAQELMNAVEEALRDPIFTSVGGEGLTVTTSLVESFIVQALLSSAEGPHTEPRDQGFAGFGSVEISVHTRTTYLPQ